MADKFHLSDCLRKVGSTEENRALNNSVHRCWACANAYGGCKWSEVDPKTDRVRFGAVPGWTVRRRICSDHGRPAERITVLQCPKFVEERG